ncbi:MAG TPA: condensation domain-containing protein, partial [Burkholderiaceae bacterium]|nr:condensation domain-containing protein [Burkholderiaceae bacterium]
MDLAPPIACIPPGERRVILSAGQEGVWVAAGLDDRAAAAYAMVFAFDADGAVDLALLERTLDVLQDRHEVLRARVVDEGGGPRLALHAPGSVARIRVARRSGTLQAVADAEAARAIDLAAAPLMQVFHVQPAP